MYSYIKVKINSIKYSYTQNFKKIGTKYIEMTNILEPQDDFLLLKHVLESPIDICEGENARTIYT